MPTVRKEQTTNDFPPEDETSKFKEKIKFPKSELLSTIVTFQALLHWNVNHDSAEWGLSWSSFYKVVKQELHIYINYLKGIIAWKLRIGEFPFWIHISSSVTWKIN